jgi:hypothetical protein
MVQAVAPGSAKANAAGDANGSLNASLSAILAACLAYGLAQVASAPAEPIADGDAFAFLIFHASRPSGYPLALWLFGAKTTVLLQPLAYAAALAWLSCEILVWTRSRWLTVALFLCLAVNPAINKWHDHVMSESLFLTVQLCVLAAVVRAMRTRSVASLALASLLVGAAASVRQPGLFLAVVPLLLAFAFAGRNHLLVMLAAALVPALAVVGVERTASGLVRGQAMFNTQLSEHLYSQGALIESPAEEAAVARFAPIRALIRNAPDTDVRQTIVIEYVNCVQHRCSDRLEIPLKEKQRVGLSRILAAPWQYAGLLWLQYRGLWAVYSPQHPALAAGMKAYIDMNRPLPFEDLVPALVSGEPRPFLSRYARVIRPAIIAVGIATAAIAVLGWLLVLMRKADDLFLLGLACASGAHLSLLFIAVFGGGAPRYTASVWPTLMLALLLVAASVLGGLARRFGKGRMERAIGIEPTTFSLGS